MRNYAHQPSGTVDRARTLRRDATEAEKALWKGLREGLSDAKFRRQSPIGPFFADFLSFRHKLVIEVDGGQHGETPERDAARTRFLENEGYRVLRFWNNEVLENIEGVLERISLSLREREGAPKARKSEGEQS